jgi:hypothetical protein
MKASRRARQCFQFLCVCTALAALQACHRKTDADDSAAKLTPDTELPSTPAELTAHAASSSSIDLTWKTATDNVGVVAYRVYRSDAASFVASVTSTTYADTGLAAETEYAYTVRAVDAAGNESSASNSANASTLSAAAVEDESRHTSNAALPPSLVSAIRFAADGRFATLISIRPRQRRGHSLRFSS